MESVLHDPLAVAVAFDPSLISSSEPLALEVRFPDDGRPFIRPNPEADANIQVVREVHHERFDALFAERITGRK